MNGADELSHTHNSVTIRAVAPADFDALWPMFEAVVRSGDVFYFDTVDYQTARDLWLGKHVHAFVACVESQGIVGAYYIRTNLPGRASHIANGTYMVAESYRGRGLGRRLGEHSMKTARQLGFQAMQFNCVVETNTSAVALWKSLGFEIVGTVPRAFRHERQGLVGAHIMYRELADGDTDR